MEFFLIVLTIIFGMCLGSFFNVVSLYLENKKNVFKKKRSFCPKCKKKLNWYDLIPLVSFVILRGKCRNCGEKISWRYFLVELFDGFMVGSFSYYFLSKISPLDLDNLVDNFQYFFAWILIVVTIQLFLVTFLYDLKKKMVSDKVVLIGIIIALIYNLIFVFRFEYSEKLLLWPVETLFFNNNFLGTLMSFLVSSFVVTSFFWLLNFVSKGKWIGGGDVKIIFWFGLLFGWPMMWLVLLFSFIVGSLFGIVTIILKKNNLKSELPLAPFLCLTAFVIICLGDFIYNEYLYFIFTNAIESVSI